MEAAEIFNQTGCARPEDMTDDFSLARPAGHLIMGDGSGPDGLATKDGAKALSRAASVDTATAQLDTPSRTKNLIIEYMGRSRAGSYSRKLQVHDLVIAY
jgi:hypothetical protein